MAPATAPCLLPSEPVFPFITVSVCPLSECDEDFCSRDSFSIRVKALAPILESREEACIWLLKLENTFRGAACGSTVLGSRGSRIMHELEVSRAAE